MRIIVVLYGRTEITRLCIEINEFVCILEEVLGPTLLQN